MVGHNDGECHIAGVRVSCGQAWLRVRCIARLGDTAAFNPIPNPDPKLEPQSQP